ncbi:serine protease 38-like [Belonocnema kinseyi]|uniref:serine protease 38-like n=1 Tax=Belonocnema kinseyi TaxID=2817044 RepID=UPI00143E0C80|nr:serine protease 38-like [Belonocnema kinseyi]
MSNKTPIHNLIVPANATNPSLLQNNLGDESADFHIRRKRVIKLDKNGDDEGQPIWIENARYIVNIQRHNFSVCAGTILSAIFVLVLRSCVYPIPVYSERYAAYTIFSGSESRNSGSRHTIRRSIRVEPNKQLALIEVSPHFYFEESPNKPISLFLGALPPPPRVAYGIFSGWGCTKSGSECHKRVYPTELMQVRLPIIPLVECIGIYEGYERITDQNICTLDETKRRGTCYRDEGGPLAVQFPPLQAPHLLGVLLFGGYDLGVDPDVFINLNHYVVNQWITHTINHHVVN